MLLQRVSEAPAQEGWKAHLVVDLASTSMDHVVEAESGPKVKEANALDWKRGQRSRNVKRGERTIWSWLGNGSFCVKAMLLITVQYPISDVPKSFANARLTSLRLDPNLLHHLDEPMDDGGSECRLRMVRESVPKLTLLNQEQETGVERAKHP